MKSEVEKSLDFEPEIDPVEFLIRPHGSHETETGSRAIPSATPIGIRDETNWDFDLSPAHIVGDGLADTRIAPSALRDDKFLETGRRGRRSARKSVLQKGFRVSIDSKACVRWAARVHAKGSYTRKDLQILIDQCEGNGHPYDLKRVLRRNLEVCGLEMVEQKLDQADAHWDCRVESSVDEIEETILAALSCNVVLPGVHQSFTQNRAMDLRELERMVRARKDLLVGIISNRFAMDAVIQMIGRVAKGTVDARFVTAKRLSVRDHRNTENSEFSEAVKALTLWHTTGGILDGKPRRDALRALEALELTQEFQRWLVVETRKDIAETADPHDVLGRLLADIETATDSLVSRHITFVRRFASRNVEAFEDPEEVFQVAFAGLLQSTRTFDPERKTAFFLYSVNWMRVFLSHWRAAAGTPFRIPLNTWIKFAGLRRAEQTAIRNDASYADDELTSSLGLTHNEVEQYLQIPRFPVRPGTVSQWNRLLRSVDPHNSIDESEINIVVQTALALLKTRDADVLRMRFGIGDSGEMTLEEIGKRFGVSRERARQLEARAFKVLQKPNNVSILRTMLGA